MEIDGQPEAGAQDMLRRVAGPSPGAAVRIGLMRKNEQNKQVSIVGERPPNSCLH